MGTHDLEQNNQDQPVCSDMGPEVCTQSSGPGADEALLEEATCVLEDAQDELDAKEGKIEELTHELEEYKDKYLRLHAEWDTYRRRMSEQRTEERLLAAEKIVSSLLPVIDDFERTIAYAQEHGEQGLLDGVSAVHTKLLQILVADGVELIDPKGQPFDSLEAQAVGVVDDSSIPHETVVEVYQKGYKMGSKVIRPAMVTVSSGGSSAAASKE